MVILSDTSANVFRSADRWLRIDDEYKRLPVENEIEFDEKYLLQRLLHSTLVRVDHYHTHSIREFHSRLFIVKPFRL
jgi:hypothetical protein